MLFLTLSSDQPNCTIRENEFSWSLHNFDLGCHKWVGLSSLSLDFKSSNTRFDTSVELCTNLIDQSYFNEFGVIHTIPGKFAYAQKRTSIEFWKVDSRNPKIVTFTFRHANVNIIKNFKVTLVFAKTQNAPRLMVRISFCSPINNCFSIFN